MLNYVIISKDFNFSRYLINCLNSKNDNLRMISIAVIFIISYNSSNPASTGC